MFKYLKILAMGMILGAVVLRAAGPAEVPTAKPGETVEVRTRTVKTIIVKDGPQDAPRSSWRCTEIPDANFKALGTYGGKGGERAAWREKAGQFIVELTGKCPSFAALEKELPPWLNEQKYTDYLAVAFEMNRNAQLGDLMHVARGTDLDRHTRKLEEVTPKRRADAKWMKGFNEETNRLKLRVAAAETLIHVRFAKEFNQRSEASANVRKFIEEYQDRKGRPHTENVAGLKKWLRELPSPQKVALRSYIEEVMGSREFPKSNILTEPAKVKGNRSVASTSENPKATALRVLMWELE